MGKPEITWDDFERVEMVVGRVLEVRLSEPMGDRVLAADLVEQHLSALRETARDLLAVIGEDLLCVTQHRTCGALRRQACPAPAVKSFCMSSRPVAKRPERPARAPTLPSGRPRLGADTHAPWKAAH